MHATLLHSLAVPATLLVCDNSTRLSDSASGSCLYFTFARAVLAIKVLFNVNHQY